MRDHPKPLDLTRLRVQPLSSRRSLSRIEDILIDPDGSPPAAGAAAASIDQCHRDIRRALDRNAGVLLLYGAHLIKNGQLQLNLEDEIVKGTLVAHGGQVVHPAVLKALGQQGG